jgi:hypothetical protein
MIMKVLTPRDRWRARARCSIMADEPPVGPVDRRRGQAEPAGGRVGGEVVAPGDDLALDDGGEPVVAVSVVGVAEAGWARACCSQSPMSTAMVCAAATEASPIVTGHESRCSA